MARITVEDCLKRIPNRFLIVNLAAKRVRQIREGSEYLVSSPKNEDIVVALRELAAGKVKIKMSESLPELQHGLAIEAETETAEATEDDAPVEAQAEADAPTAQEPADESKAEAPDGDPGDEEV